jgi:prefoldin subunit 5
MEILQDELAKLRRESSLSQSIDDIDKIIEQLERARESVLAGKEVLFV